jgi:HEAT repeat protein
VPPDDLEFFLLDIVSTGFHGLPVFDLNTVHLGLCLNCHIPQFTKPELIAALLECHETGDLEIVVEQANGRRSAFRPNAEEIEAGIAGAVRMSYRLTPQGGERWAQIAGIDWKLWSGDCWGHIGSITAADRQFTEFLFEWEIRRGNAVKPISWKEVRPWKPVYWREEPVGYQVRYRSRQEGGPAGPRRFPSDWQDFRADTRHAPVLSPRRQRRIAPEVRPFESLRQKQLEGRLNHRSDLTRLAAATELGRRPDSTSLLIELLERRCPATRFAAARALGRRRVKEAVPALLGVLLGSQDTAAADALGRIGDRRALGPLLTLFEWWHRHTSYPEPKFFEAVERAVVQFGDKAIGRLEKLAQKSPALRTRLLWALSHSRSQHAIRVLIEQMPERFETVAEVLARMGDDARACLFHLAANETQPTRSREAAAEALAETPGAFQEEGRRIAEPLHQGRTLSFLRTKIALAITGDAKSKVNDPVSALTLLLRHAACAKRRAAVDLLAELGARTAAHDIAQLASDDRWEVRASVARVLLRWGEPGEAIERMRLDPDIIVRGCARWLG